jgi:hypothetical protein
MEDLENLRSRQEARFRKTGSPFPAWYADEEE